MQRFRFNVTHVSPGHVTCSLYQSDNSVNWACAGTDITFGREWFERFLGKPEEGRRFEVEFGVPMEVGP
jgi:hypothetical protein